MNARSVGVWLLLVSANAPAQTDRPSSDPLARVQLGLTHAEATQGFLRDPPAKLARDKRTGKRKELRGYFLYERAEEWFGVPVRVNYAFTVRDSLLGYVLMTYVESERIAKSPVGLRDTLWDRLHRARGLPTTTRTEGDMIQHVWRWGRHKVVATRSDRSAKTLVVSLTVDQER